tara:strand:- start:140 stop:544 length:405 start_codon:yes stop_codon:yes gene_type:complete
MEPGTHYTRKENLSLNRNTMTNKALGLLIRKLRKAKGLSLRKLAKQVDVSFVNIAHIENGRVVTSKKVLKQLARALNYNLDKLLATGKRVDDDIENIIRKKPGTVPEFLRTAKNLSNAEWQQLTDIVKNMNKKK